MQKLHQDFHADIHSPENLIFSALQHVQIDVALYLAKHCKVNATNQAGQTASCYAAMLNQYEVADVLIERGENFLVDDIYGHNYIYYLLRHGEYERYKQLAKEFNLDPLRTFNGLTGFEIAAQSGHKFLIDYFISKQVPYTLYQSTGWELIHFAVKADHLGYLKKWLAKTCDHQGPIEGGADKSKTLAYIAAENGSRRCLKALLKNAKLEHAFKDQHLLFAGVKSGRKKIIHTILTPCESANISIDDEQNNMAHLGCQLGHTHLLNYLYSCGVDFKAKNKSGLTCFHIAILNDHAYLLKKLLKLVPKENWPEDLLSFAREKNKKECVKVLLKKFKQSEVVKTDTGRITNSRVTDQHNMAIIQALKEADEVALREKLANFLLDQVLFKYKNNILPLLHIVFKLEAEWAIPLLLEQGVNPLCTDANGETIFHFIAKSNKEKFHRQLRLLEKYLSEHKEALLNSESTQGETVFSIAAKKHHTWVLEPFIQAAADYQNQRGDSLMHLAVIATNIEAVKKMLIRGWDPNLENNQGVTPLMLAASTGSTPLIQLLLVYGANADKKDIHQLTALHHAILGKHSDAALQLIPVMKKVHLVNELGNTPFMLAAAKGLIPVVEGIAHKDTAYQHCNHKGLNAIHLAAHAGQTEIVVYLSQQLGFDIHIPQADKNKGKPRLTPLQLAARNGQVTTCRKLIELGAESATVDNAKLSMVERAIQANQPVMHTFLQSMNIEMQPNYFLIAAESNNVNALTDYLLKGDDINVKNDSGRNALHLACQYRSADAVQLLIDQGITLETVANDGNTPLHDVAASGSVSIIRQLCAKKIALDKLNNEGKTPLYLACENGHYTAVMQLLKLGARWDIADKDVLTPAQVAAAKGHFEIVRLLTVMGDRSLTSCIRETLPAYMQSALLPYQVELNKLDEAMLHADTQTQLAILLDQTDVVYLVKNTSLAKLSLPKGAGITLFSTLSTPAEDVPTVNLRHHV